MYCPKCSMLLIKKETHYECSSGKLEYSIHLSKVLDELFVAVKTEQNQFNCNGKFFCPQCGKELNKYSCDFCNISIDKIIYELVERHPHGTNSDSFR